MVCGAGGFVSREEIKFYNYLKALRETDSRGTKGCRVIQAAFGPGKSFFGFALFLVFIYFFVLDFGTCRDLLLLI